MEDDDWQFMLEQDPAYILWLLMLERQYKGEQMQQEHSESILASPEEFDWEKFNQEEERYWAEWDEIHGEEDDE